ncbi:hypothetical protein LSH36_37g01016 [Paralvinella palmiformis]|uniref:GPI ethanolamine phosphate transferase 1 n=1 Tax=Paralvinella palmiformis TaxID=53620 RepID=A0AAD9K7N7_9ANNE|nr:hypothetical protein LSH36_37g01016 [Paralvinella palmiformis]
MLQKQKTTLTRLFSPFKKLTPSMQVGKLRHIRKLIQERKFQESILESVELIGLALEGLSYYHNYDKLFLGISICLGFIGWIIYIFTVLIHQHTNIIQRHSQLEKLRQSFWTSEKGLRMVFGMFGISVMALLYAQSLPLNYYFYCLTPVILWHKVAQRHQILKDVYYYVVDSGYTRTAIILALTGLAGLELIVWSFSYRELLSVGLVAMAAWSFIAEQTEKLIKRGWVISLLSLAVFPLLPVVGREPNYYLVYFGGVLALCCALYVCLREETAIFSSSTYKRQKTRMLAAFQLLLVLLSVMILYNTQSNISEQRGLPLLNQILSWFILILSFIVPLFSSTVLYQRLFSIALSFIPLYILLSTAHEVMFFLNLCFVMFFWLRMENTVREKKIAKVEYLDFRVSQRLGEVPRKLLLSDLRCAYFFIFFLFTAFFGTGNIASINSFDPSSVLCFLTVFNPFVMGALMMWKILVPFMLVTCMFNAVHLCVNVPTQSLFLLVLLMSDVMALNFFFLVRDYGSWLEIGTSISHYVIVMAAIIFLNVLLTVSRVFTNFQIRLSRSRDTGKEQ